MRPNCVNDRTRGLMVGIAAGNLLGIVQEGWSRRRVAEAYPDGVREIAATTGYPATRTTMTLAQAIVIAEAAEQGQLDPDDLGRRFWEWAETNGLGMGGLTGHVLELYGGDAPQFLAATRQHGRVRTPVGMPITEASRVAWGGSRAGNGAAMRCAPIAIRWRDDPVALVRNSIVSAVPTHWDTRCGWSCALLNLAAATALRGESITADELLDACLDGVRASLPKLQQYGYGAHVTGRGPRRGSRSVRRRDCRCTRRRRLDRVHLVLSVCALPRRSMGHQRQYVRRTGDYMLAFNATDPDYGLPYGVYPRLLFAWICTEAVRTKTPRLVLGRSLNEFLTTLGIKSSNSRGNWDVRTHVIRQMQRLFGCVIHLEVAQEESRLERVQHFISGIAEIQNLWWDPRDPEVQMLWTSSIELNHRLFREIVEQAVPLDMRILRAIRRSPLGIDLYMLITNEQVGSEPNRRGTKDVSRFRATAIRELKKLKIGIWVSCEAGEGADGAAVALAGDLAP